jgi:3-carboxy-cis,cis-muconate cycloisomerase
MEAATGPGAWVAALLAFERELAAAEADLGIVAAASARAVADATARFDVAPGHLGVRARDAGNPVVPLVARLRALAGEHGSAVHYGATSQDALDTAAMLVAKAACGVLLADLDAAREACAVLARGHRATVMTGRTLLQPAVPVTFGLKAAGWLVGLTEAAAALGRVEERRLCVQLGGAAGTMAAFGDQGPALCSRLAERLSLGAPALPWHTDRTRVLELAGALATVAAVAAKVALDVVLLAQAEVGEVHEAASKGRGGSSTMPQKANPVASVLVLAGWRRAQAAAAALGTAAVQDHERAGTGGWHAEWQSLTDLLTAAGGCAAGVRRVLLGLSVDPGRMTVNLGRTQGVVVAERVALDLARDLGREEAADVVGRASATALAETRPLRDVLGAMPEVTERRSAAALDALCDPAGYLGAADLLVDRALDLHEAHRGGDARRTTDGRA